MGGIYIIPNIISCIRLILIPIFVIAFFQGDSTGQYWIPLFIFVLSGISDVLDGYIARKYNMVTKIGTLLDPLADKLTLLAVMGCLATKHPIMMYFLLIVFIKEVALIIGATFLFKKRDEVIKANAIGKLSTFAFYIAMILMLLKIRPYDFYFAIVAICITLVALASYTYNYTEAVKQKE